MLLHLPQCGESLIGATCTFTAGYGSLRVLLQISEPRLLALLSLELRLRWTLDNFQDAPDADGNRADLTQWGAVPVAGNTFDLDLDLSSHDKLAALGVAGGDMSTLVSAILTMHRKLDPTILTPEIPQAAEDAFWQVARGTTLKLAEDYVNNTTTVVVELDGAVGDIPFPLSGTIRLLNLQDGVGSTGGSAPPALAGDGGFVAYTRTKRSGTLTCAITPDASGAGNFPTGCRVELDGSVNGFTTNKGFSPTIDNKQLSGILWELTNALATYIVLEGR